VGVGEEKKATEIRSLGTFFIPAEIARLPFKILKVNNFEKEKKKMGARIRVNISTNCFSLIHRIWRKLKVIRYDNKNREFTRLSITKNTIDCLNIYLGKLYEHGKLQWTPEIYIESVN
jgi:hypothetical protein